MPHNLQERLLYRDGLMLVLDKPAGLPVHAGPRGGENLEQYFDSLRFGLPAPPALAHRLDRDTSGCLILGRHRKALRRLGKLFTEGTIEKRYLAILEGTPKETSGTIDQPLAKQSTAKNRWWMKIAPDGQPSVTGYRVLGTRNGLTLAEFRPRTGRTHQIRVHAAFLGCPLLHDPVYGKASQEENALYLHAASLSIPLYPNRETIQVRAALPDRWQKLPIVQEYQP